MFKKTREEFLRFSKAFLLAALVLLGSAALADWTAPVAAPPTCASGNQGCDAPINVSATAQTKTGNLTIGSGGTNVLISATGYIWPTILNVGSTYPTTPPPNSICLSGSCITAWSQAGGGGTDYQAFTTAGAGSCPGTGTNCWTKPSGTTASSRTLIECWGAGGGGSANGGGGGGAYRGRWVLTSSLGATEPVTIPGTSNTATAGAAASFGTWATAPGGGASNTTSGGGGGGGGGYDAAGGNAGVGGGGYAASGGNGGNAAYSYGLAGLCSLSSNVALRTGTDATSGGGGGGAAGCEGADKGGDSITGGGGGGGNHGDGNPKNGGNSIWGGGGGSAGSSGGSGGRSMYGGAGGATGVAGTAPGGGGGRNAQGARGECRVTTFK
ncbi:MAG TPA: hypothetical protein VHD55_00185 [Candidatus Paceibacterota bacterium]|nr:hypothetical protein [Candidatus Paceibacterota bacterium]